MNVKIADYTVTDLTLTSVIDVLVVIETDILKPLLDQCMKGKGVRLLKMEFRKRLYDELANREWYNGNWQHAKTKFIYVVFNTNQMHKTMGSCNIKCAHNNINAWYIDMPWNTMLKTLTYIIFAENKPTLIRIDVFASCYYLLNSHIKADYFILLKKQYFCRIMLSWVFCSHNCALGVWPKLTQHYICPSLTIQN